MKSAQILTQKINDNTITTGVLTTFHFWPGMVELAVKAGLDYLIIDLEHLSHDAERVAEACTMGRRMDFPILIRPPQAEMVPLRLAMDLGPCGLLVPYVEGPETLDMVRDAVYMKPRGKRRPGGWAIRWVEDYSYSTFKSEVEDDLIILPQIESRAGLDCVAEIAGHPLTTAMAIGPYDLSADLGVCWEPDHPKLQDALTRIREAARSAGKNMWVIGDGPTLVQQGFTFLCLGDPILLMEATLRGITEQLKSGE